MNFKTEDVVRDEAASILGLGPHDTSPNMAASGVGQITTFNTLGFPGIIDKPDGWYLPNNTANPALILETKASNKNLNDPKWVAELMKNMNIARERYTHVVGLLHNGHDTKTFITDFEDIIETTHKVSDTLQPKEYYLALFTQDKIDQGRIYSLTKKINDSLHFDFGIKNLNHRMIFTACALVAMRFGGNFLDGMDYNQFHQTIQSTLNKEAIRNKNQSAKMDVLSDVFSEIKMNLNVTSDNEKTSRRVKQLIEQFTSWVREISNAVRSDSWRGEDVMGIFFNEFSRYKAKSEAGQVFTPDHITGFIYKLTKTSHHDKVLDATCGSGGFLVKAMSLMIEEVGGINAAQVKKIKTGQLYGIEFDREVYALACANMLIHKDGRSNLHMDDARSASAGEWIKKQGITKVLMNPPYENKYGCMNIVENVLDNVKRGTVAAFILPDKKLEKASKTQMNRILKNHQLTHVIKLPENLFFGVGATTSIFMFKTGTPQKKQEFFACYIEDDGLETVKNQGRQDVRGKWAGIEAKWLKIIKRKTGDDSVQWNDPSKCLSWQEPPVPFEVLEKDILSNELEYKAFIEHKDVANLRKRISDNILYGADVNKNGNRIDIGINIEDPTDQEGEAND